MADNQKNGIPRLTGILAGFLTFFILLIILGLFLAFIGKEKDSIEFMTLSWSDVEWNNSFKEINIISNPTIFIVNIFAIIAIVAFILGIITAIGFLVYNCELFVRDKFWKFCLVLSSLMFFVLVANNRLLIIPTILFITTIAISVLTGILVTKKLESEQMQKTDTKDFDDFDKLGHDEKRKKYEKLQELSNLYDKWNELYKVTPENPSTSNSNQNNSKKENGNREPVIEYEWKS